MITEWRRAFAAPSAFFGFIQLSTWCEPGGAASGIPAMRGQIVGDGGEGQMAALRLSNVGFSTNADRGMGCGIHPRDKQFCAERLGHSALTIVNNRSEFSAWRSPSYVSAATISGGGESDAHPGGSAAVSVEVTLRDVGAGGLKTDVYPHNWAALHDRCNGSSMYPGTCGWAAIQLAGGAWVNASVAVSGATRLTLTAEVAELQDALHLRGPPTATAYGWAPVPMMNAYEVGTGLPVLPWNRSI